MEKVKVDLVVTGYVFNDKKEFLLIYHNKLNKWLPVGGHMEQNETPDEALLREVSEETGLSVEILGKSEIGMGGNVKTNLATPFHVNVHNVGDHDHCSLFYVCKAKGSGEIKLQEEEVGGFKWVKKEDLNQEFIPKDVRNIALKAFETVE
ncbi:MAG: NUDIX domain-containing protein [Nanoarchaeota archaeon]|nr:NUDIX domain-containing protein [Nanoarchaeota archaeon]MBU1104108.1 NUDIX domain-containing protein [Nanoarchaeota archaeon]